MRRQVTRRSKKKRGLKQYLTGLLIFIIIVILGAGCGFIGATLQSLPDIGNNMQPAASSQIFDIHGKLISTVHSAENRVPVPISKVPQDLQNAFIAAEDVRFYEHSGIDPRGILRALATNILSSGVSQGGSTITQQLAKNAFLTQDRTIKRKLQEAILALEIEQKYSKQEILEMYMNQIYFGQGAYGIQMAAQTYFGKDVENLTLAQCAMIAGLPQSPNYYSPFNNLEAGKKRQAIVLEQMAKYGFITESAADEAKQQDLELATHKKGQTKGANASYFIDYIAQIIAKKYGDDALYKEGLRVYTTLDLDMQQAAENALEELPTFYTDDKELQQPQGAIVAIEPKTGYIKAMVGGRGNDSFNRATMAVRQPGSAFKPFVYLAAMEKGMTPATVYEDKKIEFGTWSPQNYERTYSGKMTLRNALTHSINTVAVQVANDVGMRNILAIGRDLGLSTLVTEGNPNDDNLATALGGLVKGVTPLDMTEAYAAFANNGVRVSPIAILKVTDRNGSILEENTPEETRVVSAKSAYMLVSMLKSVVQSGTGGGAAIGRPAAGKTGTTDDTKDAWFVGFTPDLAAAVWMGDDHGGDLGGITGGTYPATIWGHFMSEALKNTPVHDFTVPPGSEGIDQLGLYVPAPKEDPKDKDKDKDKDGKNSGSKTDTKTSSKKSSGSSSASKSDTSSDDSDISEFIKKR